MPYDTIFRDIKIVDNTLIKLNVHQFCKYDASINDKTCPICHKKDKVIPIRYGLPVSVNGENPMKHEGKTWKAGGCNISKCDPNWYCKRDRTEF
jgi:hypothetical protein